MKQQAATICAALLADNGVKTIIGSNVFNESPPDEAVFPCVTYAESNAAALCADNKETLTSVIFSIECWSKTSAWPLACAVENVMAGLGYSREYAQDAGRDLSGLHQVSQKYIAIKEG